MGKNGLFFLIFKLKNLFFQVIMKRLKIELNYYFQFFLDINIYHNFFYILRLNLAVFEAFFEPNLVSFLNFNLKKISCDNFLW